MNNFIEWIRSWTGGGVYAAIFFPLLVGALLFASLKIVKYSEIIIFKTKIGASFFGAAIIALVTSMPELITEISQARAGTPENGLGDDIGSNAFSVFLIAIAALLFSKYMFLNNLGKWTQISVIISFFMTALLSGFLIWGKDLKLGHIGLIPMFFFIIYLFTLYLTYRFGDNDLEENLSFDFKNHNINKTILLFIFWALIVVGFAILVNVNISAFQRGTKIKTDSIGGIFLAMATSLPEVVVFAIFLKKKKPAIAIASLVGSHFFNFGILFFGDIVYTAGPTFQKLEMTKHLPLAIMTTIMLFILLIHFVINKFFPKILKNKIIYSVIPIIMVIGYVLGWILILIFN